MKSDGAAYHTLSYGNEHTFTYQVLELASSTEERRVKDHRWIGRMHSDAETGTNNEKNKFQWQEPGQTRTKHFLYFA